MASLHHTPYWCTTQDTIYLICGASLPLNLTVAWHTASELKTCLLLCPLSPRKHCGISWHIQPWYDVKIAFCKPFQCPRQVGIRLPMLETLALIQNIAHGGGPVVLGLDVCSVGVGGGPGPAERGGGGVGTRLWCLRAPGGGGGLRWSANSAIGPIARAKLQQSTRYYCTLILLSQENTTARGGGSQNPSLHRFSSVLFWGLPFQGHLRDTGSKGISAEPRTTFYH